MYQSANQFSNPTDQYGYGIPDFENALNIYAGSTGSVKDAILSKLSVFPNPASAFFEISSDGGYLNGFTIQLYNVLGKQVLERVTSNSKIIDISFLQSGIYILKISKGNEQKTLKLIKK